MDRRGRYVALLFGRDEGKATALAETLAAREVTLRRAHRSDEVSAALADGRMDLAVVYVADAERPALAAVSSLAALSVPVIAVAEGEESLRRAVEAGATDYLLASWSSSFFEHQLDRVFRVLALVRRVAELERELASDTEIDSLTGLLNARGGRREMELEFARARRYGHPLAVAMIDLDHLGNLNRRLGELEGDRALVHVAGVLQKGVRQADRLARLGGDDFLLIATESDCDAALALAERLRCEIAEESSALGRVRVSIGVSSLRGRYIRAPWDLVEAAERALSQAKSAGRNRTVLAED